MRQHVRVFAWLVLFGSFAPLVSDAKTVSKPKLLVVMFDDVSTCLVGDACVDTNCVAVMHSDGSIAKQFAATDSFRAVKPSDELVTTSASVLCLHLSLAESDRKAILASVADFKASVQDASLKAMKPKTASLRTGDGEINLSRYLDGFWIAPWDAAEHIPRGITPATDGVITVVGTLDQAQDIVLPITVCGLTYGADFGLGGAGYSWIPYSNGYFFQCAAPQTFFHEWLHQVDFAYENLMGVPDLYGGVYPACGLGDPDPHRWFPSPDDCSSDPDSPACGGSCTIEFNSHVLSAHYDFSLQYVGNHCRDGRLDYGEVTVDQGGACGGVARRKAAALPMS